MPSLLKVLRFAFAALILAAVVTEAAATISEGVFNFWNFFGYFTIQSNLIGAGVLLAALPTTGAARPAWLEYVRLSAATYLAIVVVVYWTLLASADVGIHYPWANYVLHAVSGVVLVADWILEGPRRVPPLGALGVVVAYPLVWLGVVLYRGATDGWVPYPFLHPDNGYGSIAVVVIAIVVVAMLVALGLRPLAAKRAVAVPTAEPEPELDRV